LLACSCEGIDVCISFKEASGEDEEEFVREVAERHDGVEVVCLVVVLLVPREEREIEDARVEVVIGVKKAGSQCNQTAD